MCFCACARVFAFVDSKERQCDVAAIKLIFRSTRRPPPAHLSFRNFTGFWFSCASNANKACCLCFKVITDSAPQYLLDLLQGYTPPNTL